jgi:hypothetical protein
MNIIYQAVFGDFNFLPHRSNQALHGPDFTLGTQIAVTDVYNFYYNNSSDYHQSGFGAEINGIPVPTPYDPHDIIYKFPLEYGNVDSSFSGYEVELPNFLFYGVNRKRVNEVDGWGALITPSGTYTVLRLKSTISERDSVYLDTLGFGYGFDLPEQIEYKWLGQGEGVPLLQINVAGGFVSSITYKGINTTGINVEAANQFDFLIFPNPVTDHLLLRYHVDHNTTIRYSITDANGNNVTDEASVEVQPGDQVQMVSLPPAMAGGIYFMNVTEGDQIKSKPFTVSGR